MQKLIYVFLTLALFATTTGISNAEDNIQFSDDYFEFNPVENPNDSAQEGEMSTADKDKTGKGGIFSIKPSPNWNLKREREKELIEAISLNENSPDGIITQEGMTLAKNNRSLTQTASQNTLKQNKNGGPSPVKRSKLNEEERNSGVFPKTLKVRHEAQSQAQATNVETSLGDWVFDFPN